MSTPERVDPRDAAAFDAWYDVFDPAVGDGRPYAVGWTRDELRVALTTENPYRAKEIWALRDDDGEIVGGLEVQVPLLDNTSMLNGIIAVRADARRRGHGRALGQVLDARAAHHRRTILTTEVEVPLSAPSPQPQPQPQPPSPPTSPSPGLSWVNPPTGALAPENPVGQRSTSWVDPRNAPEGAGLTAGQAFATALGFSAANFEVHRVLELPLASGVLEGLAAKAAERHQGYSCAAGGIVARTTWWTPTRRCRERSCWRRRRETWRSRPSSTTRRGSGWSRSRRTSRAGNRG